jgi:hypothetical protein
LREWQGDEPLTDTSDDAATASGILEDIAALARKLAQKEPFRSASGPEALRAPAARLDEMVAPSRRAQPAIVRVAVRPARNKPAR